MATSLAGLRKVRSDMPPRVMLYGTPGIGKTTLASEFPNAVWLQTEDGTPAGVELDSFGLIETYDHLVHCLDQVHKGEHEFQTLVLDSVTATQRLIFQETCARGDDKGVAKNAIEDFPFGKGYVYAGDVAKELTDWFDFIRRDRGMAIVLIAHAEVERFNDPETVAYDRYGIALHSKIVDFFEQQVDAIILLKKNVAILQEEQGFNKKRNRGSGGDTIFMHARGRPAFVAKNRYGMPASMIYTLGHGYETLARYFPGGDLAGKAGEAMVTQATEEEVAAGEAEADGTQEAEATTSPPRRTASPRRAA